MKTSTKHYTVPVVTAVWGTELIQFLTALAILHQDDLKKLHIVPVQFIPFFICGAK